MTMVKVAAVQMCSGMSVERNVASMERLVREAHAAGAVYVQTPEMTGALMRDKTGLRAILKPESTDLVAASASSLARELGIHVHVGSTAILLDDGKVVGQLPDSSAGGDELAFVLPKGSPLTAPVSDAVDALRADGTLDELQQTWLGGTDAAPVLK